MDPHSRVPKKNISHGNEVLPQDTTHLIQRPCYQQGSPCQDPAGNRTTQRPPDHRKEMQTAVEWSCLLFIRSGQNHLARHSGRGKKTRQTEEELGRQHQEMDRPGVCQVPEGSGEQRKMEKTGCEIIYDAPTTLTVKGKMMMMALIHTTRHTLSLSHKPGAMVHTRIPWLARSLAMGSVMPTMAPLLAEYAACPIWPSNAATLAVFTTTPRWLSAVGAFFPISPTARRITLNEPTAFTCMKMRKTKSEACESYRNNSFIIIRKLTPG